MKKKLLLLIGLVLLASPLCADTWKECIKKQCTWVHAVATGAVMAIGSVITNSYYEHKVTEQSASFYAKAQDAVSGFAETDARAKLGYEQSKKTMPNQSDANIRTQETEILARINYPDLPTLEVYYYAPEQKILLYKVRQVDGREIKKFYGYAPVGIIHHNVVPQDFTLGPLVMPLRDYDYEPGQGPSESQRFTDYKHLKAYANKIMNDDKNFAIFRKRCIAVGYAGIAIAVLAVLYGSVKFMIKQIKERNGKKILITS